MNRRDIFKAVVGVLVGRRYVATSNPQPFADVFMRTQLRSVANGIGITYEQLTGDLTGVRFHPYRNSGRSAIAAGTAIYWD